MRIEHAAGPPRPNVVENEMKQERGFPHARKARDVEPQLSAAGNVGEQGPSFCALRLEERVGLERSDPFRRQASSRIQAQMRPRARESEFRGVG